MNAGEIQRDSTGATDESETSVPAIPEISGEKIRKTRNTIFTARGVTSFNPRALRNHGGATAFVLVLTVLFGAIFWAKSSDPFERIWFSIKTAGCGQVKGVTVLPRSVRACPVVVCLQDLGARLISEGNALRQFAELGMAAVGVEYNPTNQAEFDEQFIALNDYIKRQPWAQTNATAWIGFGVGAQRTLSFILNHPEIQPQVLVRCSGGWTKELDDEAKVQSLRIKASMLMVHGDDDKVFPVGDVQRLKELLQTNGISNVLKILPGKGHQLGTDHALVTRLVGEYCKAKLTSNEPLPAFPRTHPPPLLVCLLPALAWAISAFYNNNGSKTVQEGSTTRRRLEMDEGKPGGIATSSGKALRWLAAGLAALAVADMAVRLISPQLSVNQSTLGVARKWLVPMKWRDDFEMLASQPVWQGQQLNTLLEHAELANYTVNELVNWKIDRDIYKEYVLSPVIDPKSEHELKWRRLLWASFYPRVRHEPTPQAAAEILVRYMRERVMVVADFQGEPGIESIWKDQIAGENGFQEICVAALRSVGVGARLNTSGRAEFWTGDRWSTLPRPIAVSYLQ
jgi:predicted esterase